MYKLCNDGQSLHGKLELCIRAHHATEREAFLPYPRQTQEVQRTSARFEIPSQHLPKKAPLTSITCLPCTLPHCGPTVFGSQTSACTGSCQSCEEDACNGPLVNRHSHRAPKLTASRGERAWTSLSGSGGDRACSPSGTLRAEGAPRQKDPEQQAASPAVEML